MEFIFFVVLPTVGVGGTLKEQLDFTFIFCGLPGPDFIYWESPSHLILRNSTGWEYVLSTGTSQVWSMAYDHEKEEVL